MSRPASSALNSGVTRAVWSTPSSGQAPRFDFLRVSRHEKLNANEFFANRAGRAKPAFKLNQ